MRCRQKEKQIGVCQSIDEKALLRKTLKFVAWFKKTLSKGTRLQFLTTLGLFQLDSTITHSKDKKSDKHVGSCYTNSSCMHLSNFIWCFTK